jgi:hypothetical protein
MSEEKNVIIPQSRVGIWIVATLIIALLAFIMSIVALRRIYTTATVTQAEILSLNKKIEQLK